MNRSSWGWSAGIVCGGWLGAGEDAWGDVLREDRSFFKLSSRMAQVSTTGAPEMESGVASVLTAVQFGPADGRVRLEKGTGKGTKNEQLSRAIKQFSGEGDRMEAGSLAKFYAKFYQDDEEPPVITVERLENVTEEGRAWWVHEKLKRSLRRKVPVILEMRRFVWESEGTRDEAPWEWKEAETRFVVVESLPVVCEEKASGFPFEIWYPGDGRRTWMLAGEKRHPVGQIEAGGEGALDITRYVEVAGAGLGWKEDARELRRQSLVLLTAAVGDFR